METLFTLEMLTEGRLLVLKECQADPLITGLLWIPNTSLQHHSHDVLPSTTTNWSKYFNKVPAAPLLTGDEDLLR